MPGRVTIREVAKLAGVSTATVSAVINQSKYVSPELRERVEQAVDQLGYQPNLVARSLKVSETKTIGLVFTNITSPIWPPLVRTAQKVTQQAGYDTFLITTDEDVERERTSLQSLLSKRVDGIVITPAFAENHAHIRRANTYVPVVVLERKVPGIESVVTNNGEVSYQAVSHLIDHGRRRIGLLTIPVLGSNIAGRISGYRRALRENGIYDPALIREADFVGESAFDLALDLLSEADIDAIFTTSQSTAMGAYRAAKQIGRRIPDDLALFGYDDVPWMEIVDSPLSTIRQPVEEIARLATELLLGCLEEGSELPGATHILESTLIVRRSCGCRGSSADAPA
jgi:LacI family transcriptional regulator